MKGGILLVAVGIFIVLVISASCQTKHEKYTLEYDGISWEHVTDSNKKYKDFDTYKVNLSGPTYPAFIILHVIEDGNILFAWKKNVLSRYVDLSLYLKEDLRPYDKCEKTDWYESDGSIPLKKGEVVKWKFWSTGANIQGEGWVAFKFVNGKSQIDNGTVLKPIRSDTPDQNIQYIKKYITGNRLQSEINSTKDPSELILIGNTYNIDKTIIVADKSNIIIRPYFGYFNFFGEEGTDKSVILNNSSNIIIRGIRLENFKNGIKICNSNNCTIKDNQIMFKCHGYGVLINYSDNIKIIDNLIWNSSFKKMFPAEKDDKKDLSVGIKVEKGQNIYMKGNKIICNNMGHNLMIAYYISDDNNVNNITIIRNCKNVDYSSDIDIMYGLCKGYWSCSDGVQDGKNLQSIPCKIPNGNQSDPMNWSIKWLY